MIITLTILTAILLILFIKYLINDQNEKNKTKQEAAQRREADEVFSNTSTGFVPRDCSEGCYTAIDKQLMLN